MRAGGTTALAAIAAARRLLAEHLAARAGPMGVAMMEHSKVPPSPPAAPSPPLPAHRHQQWRAASQGHPHHHLDHACKDAACDHLAHQAGDGARTAPASASASAPSPSSLAASSPSLEQQEATCWSCNHATRRGGVVCRGCERIQPLDTQGLTYYELFGYGAGGAGGSGGDGRQGGPGGENGSGSGGGRGSPAPGPAHEDAASKQPGAKSRWPPYALDLRDLERRYRELQWALHPDRLAGPGREAREVAHGAAAAALVNQAYGVLRSPLARANYLLMLRRMPPEAHGGAVGTGADAAARRAAAERAAARLADEEERRTAADPALLLEVMEAREAVEEADDPAELRGMLARNREAQADLVRQLGAAFDGGGGGGGGAEGGGGGESGNGNDSDNDAADKETEQRAQELAARLSYLVRIQQAIEAKL